MFYKIYKQLHCDGCSEPKQEELTKYTTNQGAEYQLCPDCLKAHKYADYMDKREDDIQ